MCKVVKRLQWERGKGGQNWSCKSVSDFGMEKLAGFVGYLEVVGKRRKNPRRLPCYGSE